MMWRPGEIPDDFEYGELTGFPGLIKCVVPLGTDIYVLVALETSPEDWILTKPAGGRDVSLFEALLPLKGIDQDVVQVVLESLMDKPVTVFQQVATNDWIYAEYGGDYTLKSAISIVQDNKFATSNDRQTIANPSQQRALEILGLPINEHTIRLYQETSAQQFRVDIKSEKGSGVIYPLGQAFWDMDSQSKNRMHGKAVIELSKFLNSLEKIKQKTQDCHIPLKLFTGR